MNPGHPRIKQVDYPLDGNMRCETDRRIGIVCTPLRSAAGVFQTNNVALGVDGGASDPDGSNLATQLHDKRYELGSNGPRTGRTTAGRNSS